MAASGGAASAPATGYAPLLGTGEDDMCARARPAPRKYAGWARVDFSGEYRDPTYSCARTRPVPRRYRDPRGALLPPQQHLAIVNAAATAAVRGTRANNKRPRQEDTVTTVSERSHPCAQLPPGGDVCAPEATHRCKKGCWEEAETIALIDGVEKHGVGSWKAIVKENPLLQQTRTNAQLAGRWKCLVKICRLEGADVGRGRILRALTTLHESQWARIARLVEGTPLAPTKRRPPSGRHPPRAKMSEEKRKAERLKASVRKWKARVREAETPEERRAHHITLLGYLRAATRAGLLLEVATEVPCS